MECSSEVVLVTKNLPILYPVVAMVKPFPTLYLNAAFGHLVLKVGPISSMMNVGMCSAIYATITVVIRTRVLEMTS